jgi:hypothetical protein
VVVAIISCGGSESGYKNSCNIISKSGSRSNNSNRRLFLKKGFKE